MQDDWPTIGIARTHFPISALGFGRRIGVWVQGCSIGCAGCMSIDTWRPSKTPISVSSLVDALLVNASACDGLTISGGEPFDQPNAILQLLRTIHPHLSGDVLLFTGYDFDSLPAAAHEALAYVDLLIAGPYDATQACASPLRGSSNQTVHALTELGRSRFEALKHAGSQPIDVVTDESGFWLSGIPAPGDLKRLGKVLESADLIANTSVGRLGRRS